jgi:hypothetical protein
LSRTERWSDPDDYNQSANRVVDWFLQRQSQYPNIDAHVAVLPRAKSLNTSTSRGNQPNVTFDTVEGATAEARDNIELGCLVITEIELARRALPAIRVTMRSMKIVSLLSRR